MQYVEYRLSIQTLSQEWVSYNYKVFLEGPQSGLGAKKVHSY